MVLNRLCSFFLMLSVLLILYSVKCFNVLSFKNRNDHVRLTRFTSLKLSTTTDNEVRSNTKGGDTTSSKKLPLPFLNVESIGFSGKWTEKGGNFILKPDVNSTLQSKPYGVIHFLGGAFVGAAPHITYRYLLESLCEQGYVIVATPFRLEMDYIRSCDQILNKFDAVAVDLATEFGPLPVIGIGHSCGALLQTLITSLFPDTPRAVNVLISFNNRPASAAIPAFNEVIIPLAEQLMGADPTSARGNNSTELRDDPASRLRSSISSFRSSVDGFLETFSQSAIAPQFVANELLPLYKQSAEIIDQIPELLLAIAQGQREFKPSPLDTKEVCRRMYRARRTLLIKFANDELDESPEIEKVLREANTIMRMKRPMVDMEVFLKEMTGTHLTPLTQNIDYLLPDPLVPDAIRPLVDMIPEPFNPISTRRSLSSNFMRTVKEVEEEIVLFLDRNVKANQGS